jgi:predicted dienelactone hydrolase
MASAAGGGEIPPDEPGELAVGHTQATLVDASREDRELPLEIWYPADSEAWDVASEFTFYSLLGTIGMTSTASKDDVPMPEGSVYPLIVFSHGYGSLAIQSVWLVEHLASHGFVVVSPTHTGNNQGDSSSENPEADRYPDVAFVIDEMAAANEDEESVFFGHVDASNSGVAGHSYGGMTAMFMAAGHGEFPPDSRVKAIMPIAASSGTLSDSEIAGITIPTLLLVGTLDGLQAETIRSFGLIQSAPDLFRVDVVGANHTHFANVCDIGQTLLDFGFGIGFWETLGAGALVPIWESTCVPPAFPIAEATRLQNLFAAAHFRTYLAADNEYASYLTNEYAASEPDIVFMPEPNAALTVWIALASLGWLRRRGPQPHPRCED